MKKKVSWLTLESPFPQALHKTHCRIMYVEGSWSFPQVTTCELYIYDRVEQGDEAIDAELEDFVSKMMNLGPDCWGGVCGDSDVGSTLPAAWILWNPYCQLEEEGVADRTVSSTHPGLAECMSSGARVARSPIGWCAAYLAPNVWDSCNHGGSTLATHTHKATVTLQPFRCLRVGVSLQVIVLS